MTRFRLSLALIALAGALLVACGGDGGGAPAAPPSSPPAGQVRLTYYGHSMFTIETPGGVTVLTDPNQGMGYRAPEVAIDVITVSHDHFDHDKIGVARGALVLRGLISDGDWSDVDTTIGDVRIRSARSYHDEQQGAVRGKNTMFIFEVAGLRIVHGGDLGQGRQSFESVRELQAFLGLSLNADVFMLPVGGHFTIGAQEADDIIASRHPKLLVPMHYRTDALHDFPDKDELSPLDDFLKGKANVRREGSSTLLVGPGLPTGPEIVVLEHQPE